MSAQTKPASPPVPTLTRAVEDALHAIDRPDLDLPDDARRALANLRAALLAEHAPAPDADHVTEPPAGSWETDGWLIYQRGPDGSRWVIGTFGATGIGGVRADQRRADARLAAAAPDLRDATRGLLAVVAEMQQGHGDEGAWIDIERGAREALDRASEGGAARTPLLTRAPPALVAAAEFAHDFHALPTPAFVAKHGAGATTRDVAARLRDGIFAATGTAPCGPSCAPDCPHAVERRATSPDSPRKC